jgi:cobalt/nickel transport system permease protein
LDLGSGGLLDRSPSIHPTSRLSAALTLIAAINLAPVADWMSLLLPASVVAVCLAVLRVPWSYLVKGFLLAVPFLLAAALIPLTTPGAEAARLPLVGVTVTSPGLALYLTVSAKILLSVSVVLELNWTTPSNELLEALASLRVPAPLIGVMGLMHRYLAVIGEEGMAMMRARASRCGGPGPGFPASLLLNLQIAGRMLGSLFLRSYARSERLHAAMLSRGFDGQPRGLPARSLRPRDWAFVAAAFLLLAAVGARRFT